MIFVTIGNNKMGFPRLLKAVDALAGVGILKNEEVVLQSGNISNWKATNCFSKPFFPMDEYLAYLKISELIISHAGCGTLLHSRSLGKIPVVMPRRKKYQEHINDHQMELLEAFHSMKLIVPAYEPEDLPEAINRVRGNRGFSANIKSIRMKLLVKNAMDELIARK